ncbi:tetratricopeptide repeat protein, partial [Aquimarina litoralis]|uniref:tetratricopeptide repeat protein n=1 Tax=Aquimarina litoralis TaxID=584605 RepID=UPI001C568B8E
MKTPLIIIFFCLCFSYTYSKQELQRSQTIKDSLQSKTLGELYDMFWKVKELDSIAKVRISDAYIKKAKKVGDGILIADGYQMYLHMYQQQYNFFLKYTDSIIDVTKDIKDSQYPATGYLMKGGVLISLERYDEALSTFLKAKNSSHENGHNILVLCSEHKIAELKTILGKNQEALEIHKRHYKSLYGNKKINKNDQIYLATVFRLAESYNKLKMYDSANVYINEGIKLSLSNYYHHFYPELVFTSGINNFYKGYYQKSIDSLQKSIILFENNSNDIKVRTSYLYMGKCYQQLRDDQKALNYLQKVDSITNVSNYRIEISEAFELLKEYYTNDSDVDKL